jgi:hypothetical protein
MITNSGYYACTNVSFLINGSPHVSTPGPNGQCLLGPDQVLNDQDHVQASVANQSYQDQTNGSASTLTAVSDVGLLGVGPVGAPTCSADLVSRHVVCHNLNAGTFAISATAVLPCRSRQLQTQTRQPTTAPRYSPH